MRHEVSGVTQANAFPQPHDAYRMRAKCDHKVSRGFVKRLSPGYRQLLCCWSRATFLASSSLVRHRRPSDGASQLEREGLLFANGNRATQNSRDRPISPEICSPGACLQCYERLVHLEVK